MARLGILSDTHASSLSELPEKAVEDLLGLDLVIHVGDYTGQRLLAQLKQNYRFKGVYGNMDSEGVLDELKPTETMVIDGYRIGITHPPEGGNPFGLPRRVLDRFKNIDLLIYGHTHTPAREFIDGVLCINPGSLTGRFPARERTFMILDLSKGLSPLLVKV